MIIFYFVFFRGRWGRGWRGRGGGGEGGGEGEGGGRGGGEVLNLASKQLIEAMTGNFEWRPLQARTEALSPKP